MSNERSLDKKTMRKAMKAVRSGIVRSSDGIAKNFLSLPEVQRANTCFLYRSFSTEADTMPVIEALLSAGKTVLLPREEGIEMAACPYRAGDRLLRNTHGIEEPITPPYEGKIDVILLPLLAVDVHGYRLGYGGGFYDRFLKKSGALKVAYCFEEQVVEEVPKEEHDEKLDVLVTDKRIVRIEK